MDSGFGKYGHTKRKAQVLKNKPRVKGDTEKREKDMIFGTLLNLLNHHR